MRSIVLKAEGLKKYYHSGENVTKALDGIDLDICYGGFAAIVGTSGSGKSTLLHMLGGLDIPTEGTVRVGDRELSRMNDEDLAVFRRRNIGFVFQQTKRAYSLIGGILSAILGAIGILNFINIVVTGILTRQKELAMLSAVGMGGRQMKKMLAWESAAYIGSAALLTITAGNLISWLICQDATIQNQWAFVYHFTVLPVAVCLPILLLAAVAVPLVSYQKMCKNSVVERLRCV